VFELSQQWLKIKNPAAPAVKHEAEETRVSDDRIKLIETC
jgi:hypothetical protein